MNTISREVFAIKSDKSTGWVIEVDFLAEILRREEIPKRLDTHAVEVDGLALSFGHEDGQVVATR